MFEYLKISCLSPVFGLGILFQSVEGFDTIDDHVAGAFAPGHGALDDEEGRSELEFLLFVNLGKDYQRDMPEFIFQRNKHDLAAGPLAADDQPGNGYFRAVPEAGDIFAAGHLFLKPGAYP